MNAANTRLQAGGGVCGAIFRRAGREKLQAACDAIGYCAVGQAVITSGFGLPARYVIHTAGPVWQGGGKGEAALLRGCYRNALELAKREGLESVAFPLISAGIFGYPRREAMTIAVSTIGEFLLENDMEVYLVIFDGESFALGEKLQASIQAFIDDRYVDEHAMARNQRLERERQIREMSFSQPMADAEALSPGSDREDGATFDDASEQVGHWSGDSFADTMPIPQIPVDRQPHAPRAKLAPRARLAAPRATKPALDAPFAEELESELARMGEDFPTRLFRLIDERGLTDPQVYKRANLDRKLFSKIRTRPDYRPGKNTVLALCIALRLNLEQTEDLLRRAGLALSPGSKADLIVEYFIRHRNYNVVEINEALFAFHQELLGAKA